MKLLLFSFFLPAILFSQLPETDIWLFDLKEGNGKLSVSKGRNITNREGYDNQPSFSPDSKRMYFTSVRDTSLQSDIYYYDLEKNETKRFTYTKTSEYSPVVTPDQSGVSAVVVEPDSTQRIWLYAFSGRGPLNLFPNVDSVGYYSWKDSLNVIFFKLGNPPALYQTKENSESFIHSDIGRGMSAGNRKIYFISKIDTSNFISSMENDSVVHIIQSPEGSEDFTIFRENYFISGKNSRLFFSRKTSANSQHKKTWELMADLKSSGIKNITRIAVSPDGRKIAVVGTR